MGEGKEDKSLTHELRKSTHGQTTSASHKLQQPSSLLMIQLPHKLQNHEQMVGGPSQSPERQANAQTQFRETFPAPPTFQNHCTCLLERV